MPILKGNGVYLQYIDRDSIFPHLDVNEEDGLVKDTALKFTKMVSFNAVFTIVGLKRFEKKAGRKSRVSAHVDDVLKK